MSARVGTLADLLALAPVLDRHGWPVPPSLVVRAARVRAAGGMDERMRYEMRHHDVHGRNELDLRPAFAGARGHHPVKGGFAHLLDLDDACVAAWPRIDAYDVDVAWTGGRERAMASPPATGETVLVQHVIEDGSPPKHVRVAGDDASVSRLLAAAADLADLAPDLFEDDVPEACACAIDRLDLEATGEASRLSFVFHSGWRQIDPGRGRVPGWFRDAVQTLEANLQTGSFLDDEARTRVDGVPPANGHARTMATFHANRAASSATVAAARATTREAKARALARLLVGIGAPEGSDLGALADGRMPVAALGGRRWTPRP